jgi:hypothetical protein
MVLNIDEKAFIFEVFLKKHKLYDRYVAYQHKHHNREIIDVVKESNFSSLLSGTILWDLEIQEFSDMNHLDYDDPHWDMYAIKWQNFVSKLLNE